MQHMDAWLGDLELEGLGLCKRGIMRVENKGHAHLSRFTFRVRYITHSELLRTSGVRRGVGANKSVNRGLPGSQGELPVHHLVTFVTRSRLGLRQTQRRSAVEQASGLFG